MVLDRIKLRELRTQKGLTQKALGLLCDPPISDATIRRYEAGTLKPKAETIIKIAKALNCKPSDIINLDMVDLFSGNANASLVDIHTYDFITEPNEQLINNGEKMLLHNYRQLNETGKTEAQKQVKNLTYIPEYTE